MTERTAPERAGEQTEQGQTLPVGRRELLPAPTPYAKASRRPWILGLVGLILVAGAWAGWSTLSTEEPVVEDAAVARSTATVQVRDLVESSELSGTLSFADDVEVSAGSGGVVTYLAEEGAILERGDVLFAVDREPSETDIAAADQRVASARSSLAAAQSQRSNTLSGAGAAEIASAEASLASAQRSLDQLTEPPTEAETLSARANVTNAEEAYRALFDGPTTLQVTSAEEAVRRAEQAVQSAEAGLARATSDFSAARSSYCALDPVPVDICDSSSVPLRTSTIDELTEVVTEKLATGDPADADIAATTQLVIDANWAYKNAETSLTAAEASLDTAEEGLADLTDAPTQAEKDQALAAVRTAEEALQRLLDGPTTLELAAAEANVEAAEARLADLRSGADSTDVAQANSSVAAAEAALEVALLDREQLLTGQRTAVLLYGDFPAWRALSTASSPGPDIRQLEENLVAFGHDADGTLVVDSTFDEATENAVKSWQADLGMEPIGAFDLGTIVFSPGPSQVGTTTATLGGEQIAGAPVLELTPIRRVTDPTAIVAIDEMETTQRVVGTLPIEDRDLLEVGDAVTVELPDGTDIPGEVNSIGTVPLEEEGPEADSESAVELIVSLLEPVDEVWTGATVDIEIVAELADDVLSVPVSALLALVEGGYAVEVVEQDDSTRLIGVDTGMFSDGFVEISGEGLEEGMRVVVP